MKEIYELEIMHNGDGESEYYEIEKDAIKKLQNEYEQYLKEFAHKRRENREYSLYLKHYKIKTDNLKEAVKLSNLDEEDVCYDLGLDLEELDKEISFDEMEYILRNMDYNNKEEVFKTINEEMPFYIGEDGKRIDRNYAYNFFKEDIINKLNYEFSTRAEKDDFIQMFEESDNKEDFKENIFDDIKLLDNKVKVTSLGLKYKDFEQELTSLYESLDKNEKIENLSELIKDYVNIDSKEIENVIKNLDDDTINKLKEIGEKIVDYRFKQSIIKGLEGAEDLENQKFIENTINEIENTEKDLENLEEKVFNKDKYAEISKLIIESIKSMLLELARDFKIELQILKEKLANKSKEELNKDTEEIDNQLNLNLTLNDKIKMATIKELPQNILLTLSKENNIKILRNLAINENLPKEAFCNLAKNSDLKLKELLLENENISLEGLDILINDKDKYIKLEAIKHKNMSSEKLNQLYDKNIKNDEIIGCIAKNKNASTELLEKISNNLNTTDENRKIAFQNKNHPINNIFTKPELSKEKSNELYQKLLFKTDIRKNDLLEMFKNNVIYADEQGNGIFPIKDSEDKIVGAYKIDFSINEKPILLENSYAKEEDLEKASRIANQIFESLQQEEVLEQVEEIEIE